MSSIQGGNGFLKIQFGLTEINIKLSLPIVQSASIISDLQEEEINSGLRVGDTSVFPLSISAPDCDLRIGGASCSDYQPGTCDGKAEVL